MQFPIDIGDEIGGAYDWVIKTVPQTQLDGSTRDMPMGKVVGGGSILNGMVWNVCLRPSDRRGPRFPQLTPASEVVRMITTIGRRSTILGGAGMNCFPTSRRSGIALAHQRFSHS